MRRCRGGLGLALLLGCASLASCGNPCAAPNATLADGSTVPENETCVEGPGISDGASCTPRCPAGSQATERVLRCVDGALSPDAFACRPCDAGARGWAWYRFLPLRLRGGAPAAQQGQGAQLGELVFRRFGRNVRVTHGLASVEGRAATAGYEPQRAIDGSTQTQWSDAGMGPLLIRFGCPLEFDQYSFFTAADAPGRDPVRWRLEGSNDEGRSWAALHEISLDYPPPYERLKVLDDWLRIPACWPTSAPNNTQVCRSTEELVRRRLTFPQTPLS